MTRNKRRLAQTIRIALLVMMLLGAVLAASNPHIGAESGLQEQEALPDLETLLDFPGRVQIMDLPAGPERDAVVDRLMARPDTVALMAAMADKGFVFDITEADVMQITVESPEGVDIPIEAMSVSTIANELSGALTVMQDETGVGFAQAHHTNLDPKLADVPDPPIMVNGMPYFYITSLRWVGGRILVWHYWWFNSHHHPNWYYSHYIWYWRYYYWYRVDWPYWYWWVHGWYYWRFWYYWSSWFPWAAVRP